MGDSDPELKALVGRATRHDPQAWEEVYRRSYRRLFNYARRRVADDHAADDVVSETMMRALDSIHRFTWRGAGFDAWLYGIARNVTFEAGRRRGRTETLAVEEWPSDEPDPGDRVVAAEQARLVRAAFARLSTEEQELLELRVQGGLTSAQVGQVVGKRAGAVRMAQSRALDRLRGCMEEVTGGH